MVTGYIFTAFLIILGLAVMRFGSIHFKKFKEGKTKNVFFILINLFD